MVSLSKLKVGLSHPIKTLVYLIFGSQQYVILETERMERNVKPENFLESNMIKPTHIHEHLATLYLLTVELNLKRIVELGTRSGESTIALLAAAKQIEGEVLSVDINPCLDAKKNLQAHGLLKNWTFIQCDDLKLEWNRTIDHLFIDTSHTFEQTVKELEKYEPWVKCGGLITLHDTVLYPEIMQAIKSFIKNRTDLRLYKYFNNNGLAIIFKGHNS